MADVSSPLSPRQQLVRMYYADRVLAHTVLFAHRRPQRSPKFHETMIRDWHGPDRFVLDLVFRGGAKSTIAEEAILLMVLFREFKNGLIVGSSVERASERLHAIKHEAETNEDLVRVFGAMQGPVWSDTELVFANGRRLLALGKGQSLRGSKFEDMRPDMIFVDDLEGELQDISTPAARQRNLVWFTGDLLPAGDQPTMRVRMAATPRHPECVPLKMVREWNKASEGEERHEDEWVVHTFPIYYLNEEGEKVSSWPERYPIEKVLRDEASFTRIGLLDNFRQEYLCEAEIPETKPFKGDMIKVEPRVRTWQAVYSMTDPARTTTAKAATTGRVVWSWIGAKLIVWDAVARRWMPDQIVDDLFDVHERWRPVWIGFEEDGLNQWALQAIRQGMVKRGVTLPLRPMKAPVGKIDFIKGLQPFFQAREVEFAKDLPDLKAQLLGFPTGEIDAPNALAYALKMRAGAPMYDDFGGKHVAEDGSVAQGRPVWVCLNASRGCVVAALVQAFDGQVRVIADAVREGEVGNIARDLVEWAKLEVGPNAQIRFTAGPLHFDQYNNVGLRQALARVPTEVRPSVPPDRGRAVLRTMLQRDNRGFPAVQISAEATWTLNALSGGYARVLQKGGVLKDYAEEGPYRLLMEGIESFLGLLELGSTEEFGSARFNAETPSGRPYRSMVAGDMAPRESKSDWNVLLRGGR